MHKISHLIILVAILSILPSYSFAESFSFATLGDTQDISDSGQQQLSTLINSINQQQPVFTVHIGELKGGSDSCHDVYYQRIHSTTRQFKGPLIYLPGDNDWTDCFQSGFDPIERLSHLRKKFYQKPVSLGQKSMPLNRQSIQPEFNQYPENSWWQYQDVLFATFHNVGTNNNLYGNVNAVSEYLARDEANIAWLEQIFAKASSAKALVLFTHANIKFDAVGWEPTGFDNFRNALIKHVRQFKRPVLLVHGDTHRHKIDKPLKYKGKTVPNFTRLEVFGSPDLGVVYIHVYPETDGIFRFEPIAYSDSK